MSQGEAFWVLGNLSDSALLAGLGRRISGGRRLTAEVIAHLGEVEARRLHLRAGCGSMFTYCVARLGFSEDEACRRIQIARLARRFPRVFELLASGRLSLSVAALLDAHLSRENEGHLLAALEGCTVQQAKEVLAAHHPRPDVASRIRKLPERMREPANDASRPVQRSAPKGASAGAPDGGGFQPGFLADVPPCEHERCVEDGRTVMSAGLRPAAESQPAESQAVGPSCQPSMASPSTAVHPRQCPRSRIEPLAPARYKVQFTADAGLKAQLELARDLMRHAVPDGDFAPIISRAVALLIERLMKQRFGLGARPAPGAHCESARGRDAASVGAAPGEPAGAENDAGAQQAAELDPRRASTPVPEPGTHPDDARAPAARAPAGESGSAGQREQPGGRASSGRASVSRRRVPTAVRRVVVERDGLQCSWVSADGVRCEARAWLELEHAEPVAKGGSSAPGNVRLYCRGHNRLAAEDVYGRDKMERAIAAARSRSRSAPPETPQQPREPGRPGGR